jgi:hypothetical protein
MQTQDTRAGKPGETPVFGLSHFLKQEPSPAPLFRARNFTPTSSNPIP